MRSSALRLAAPRHDAEELPKNEVGLTVSEFHLHVAVLPLLDDTLVSEVVGCQPPVVFVRTCLRVMYGQHRDHISCSEGALSRFGLQGHSGSIAENSVSYNKGTGSAIVKVDNSALFRRIIIKYFLSF